MKPTASEHHARGLTGSLLFPALSGDTEIILFKTDKQNNKSKNKKAHSVRGPCFE